MFITSLNIIFLSIRISNRKWLNSIIILGARAIWKHRNRHVFDGASPNLSRALLLVGILVLGLWTHVSYMIFRVCCHHISFTSSSVPVSYEAAYLMFSTLCNRKIYPWFSPLSEKAEAHSKAKSKSPPENSTQIRSACLSNDNNLS
jgi:hypothetical protein